MKRSYSTDLTDAEWECIEPHVPPPNKRGRPKTHTTREILNAIFYILKSGCAWRLLPTLGDCLLLVQEMAHRRNLGTA
jgi:putative transposase